MSSIRSVFVVALTGVALCLAACSPVAEVPAGYAAVDTRTQAAQVAASGVIAAAARRMPSDLKHYLPGDDAAEQRSMLVQMVPETFGHDPKMYRVRFGSDPETQDRIVAFVNLYGDSRAYEVTLEWDRSATRFVWDDGDYVEVSGDWRVLSVGPPMAR